MYIFTKILTKTKILLNNFLKNDDQMQFGYPTFPVFIYKKEVIKYGII